MEVILDLLDLILFALEERVLLLFLLVRLHDRGGIARNVLQVHVHFLRELQLAAVLDIVHIESILDAIVY